MSTRYKNSNRLSSFRTALQGVGYVLLKERNFQIQVVIAFVVLILGVYFHLSRLEWALILLMILLVLCLEIVNTAVEITVDLFTKKKSIRARVAKDVAAGAVFVASIGAVVMAALIFYNKLPL